MKLQINNDFSLYIKSFLQQNATVNLISKNEEKYIFEKHIYDSVSIGLFFQKYNLLPQNLLDIGTGGGFPSIPIALEYPNIQVTALDSIRKKINAINNIKQELNIKNLIPICSRAESLKDTKFDIITSRAVAKIDILAKYASPLLKQDGYFVAYKSRLADEEINEASTTLKKLNLKHIDTIEYKLPLPEAYERKLIIFQKTT